MELKLPWRAKLASVAVLIIIIPKSA